MLVQAPKARGMELVPTPRPPPGLAFPDVLQADWADLPFGPKGSLAAGRPVNVPAILQDGGKGRLPLGRLEDPVLNARMQEAVSDQMLADQRRVAPVVADRARKGARSGKLCLQPCDEVVGGLDAGEPEVVAD